MSPASRPRHHPLRRAQRSEIAGDISAHSREVDAQACRTLGGAPTSRSLREEDWGEGHVLDSVLGAAPHPNLSAEVGYIRLRPLIKRRRARTNPSSVARPSRGAGVAPIPADEEKEQTEHDSDHIFPCPHDRPVQSVRGGGAEGIFEPQSFQSWVKLVNPQRC
jgi:hypothetical protein